MKGVQVKGNSQAYPAGPCPRNDLFIDLEVERKSAFLHNTSFQK